MVGVTPAMVYRKISVGVTGTAMPAFASTLTADQRWNIVDLPADRCAARRSVSPRAKGCTRRTASPVTAWPAPGDGTIARALSKLPPEIGSFAWQAERSDSQLVAGDRRRRPGTPMPPATNLTPRRCRASWRTFARCPCARAAPVRRPRLGGQLEQRAPRARRRSRCSSSRSPALRNGQLAEAGDRAFDAYLAFEPIEIARPRARSRASWRRWSGCSADFKGAVRANDLRGAERARDAIEANMPKVVELTRPAGSASEAFLQSLLIILREGFEAILVIGAVVAFLLKTGHRERLRSIWMGIGLALVASAVTAVVLRTVLQAIPASKDIIEGLTLLVAVGVLFSVSYWLISRVEAAKWQQFIREKVNTALEHGGGRALAFVAFLAVYREGAETALFYQALFNEGSHVVAADHARHRRRLRRARRHLHAVLPLWRAHSAAPVLQRDERAALLHGVRLHGQGHSRAAGRKRGPDHGHPRVSRPSRRWACIPRGRRCSRSSCCWRCSFSRWPRRSGPSARSRCRLLATDAAGVERDRRESRSARRHESRSWSTSSRATSAQAEGSRRSPLVDAMSAAGVRRQSHRECLGARGRAR